MIPLILNSNLKLRSLVGFIQYPLTNETIQFRNIRGFELNMGANFTYDSTSLTNTQLREFQFYETKFDFYLNDHMINIEKCNESQFVTLFSVSNVFNQFVPRLSLMESIEYPTKICPFVFKNIRIDSLEIHQFAFNIDSTNYSNLVDLNAKIYNFELKQVLNLNLNNEILNLLYYFWSVI
jgi:hypothetical protein